MLDEWGPSYPNSIDRNRQDFTLGYQGIYSLTKLQLPIFSNIQIQTNKLLGVQRHFR